MGKIYNSITELVGHTPLVEFHRLEEALGLKGRILGKLEYFNPAGSHKDRIALEIIEQAEKRGEISPDKTTLVEFTSGNTGIALAAFAAAKGYPFRIGLQPGVSVERLKLLEAYNADIIPVEPEDLAIVY
ncbi:MAG: pyridoxal-phosphate dependent enzyme, partial [Lachnospiraceae bacterium]|nr:pyridoxal-phosphate dependent enzyme [Lachnospiraceae bacterium]